MNSAYTNAFTMCCTIKTAFNDRVITDYWTKNTLNKEMQTSGNVNIRQRLENLSSFTISTCLCRALLSQYSTGLGTAQ